MRGTPGAVSPVLLIFSSKVKRPTKALARSNAVAEVSQTVVFANGPLTQSGKSAYARVTRDRHVRASRTAISARCGGQGRPSMRRCPLGLGVYKDTKTKFKAYEKSNLPFPQRAGSRSIRAASGYVRNEREQSRGPERVRHSPWLEMLAEIFFYGQQGGLW